MLAGVSSPETGTSAEAYVIAFGVPKFVWFPHRLHCIPRIRRRQILNRDVVELRRMLRHLGWGDIYHHASDLT
jgi:hypothetical protein